MLIVRSHQYCPWSLLASQGYVCFILCWVALILENHQARNYPEVWLLVTVCVSNPTCKSCLCCSFFSIHIYPDLELPYTSRIRVTLSRWMFSRIQGVVPRLFCFIHLFQSTYLMLCFKGRHWQNRLGTGAEQGAACSENQNVLWEISSTRCQFTSVNRLQTLSSAITYCLEAPEEYYTESVPW